jgi:hypothetical protein
MVTSFHHLDESSKQIEINLTIERTTAVYMMQSTCFWCGKLLAPPLTFQFCEVSRLQAQKACFSTYNTGIVPERFHLWTHMQRGT